MTQLVGHGLDGALALLLPMVDDPTRQPDPSPGREAVLAALNGVMGDRLQAIDNPLAQTLELRHQGRRLPLESTALLHDRLAGASSHLIVLVHGLCMNDTQWRRNGHDHGEFLAQALGATTVYVRYNSGLHIAANGRELARQLEWLAAQWPVPLQSITLIGHSMGGLVARAACETAQEASHRWRPLLQHLVFLGTPHHGAPLERAGQWLNTQLAATPFTAPFTRLGQLRSAGITDLHQGRVREGAHEPLPLPEGVACFAVAAALAPRRGLLADRLTGDGLVPLRSALGQHDDRRFRLVFARDSQRTVYRTGHLELLSSPVVARQLLAWLEPPPPDA